MWGKVGFLLGGGLGRRGNSTTLPWPWQPSWSPFLPLSATSIDGREPDDLSSELKWKECSTKTNFKNPGEGGTIAEFSWNCIVPLKVVKDYVNHLGQMKCERKSEELKVKGSKCSGWKKITTTFNESNCKILTKCRRWKFMNLICTWYDMESCLRGRSQRKWHIYSTYRWRDLIRHYGERDFVKKA